MTTVCLTILVLPNCVPMQTLKVFLVGKRSIPSHHYQQKRICYFDNCISHQNCNCWHGFMGWY